MRIFIILTLLFTSSYGYYIVNSDSIDDLDTGLTWQDTADVISEDNPKTWGWGWNKPSPVDINDTTGNHIPWGEVGYINDIGGASGYCLQLGEGWRVPTYNELNTIIDRTLKGSETTIKSIFRHTSSDSYWTSTTYTPDPNKAREFNFLNGMDSFSNKSETRRVRCVKTTN